MSRLESATVLSALREGSLAERRKVAALWAEHARLMTVPEGAEIIRAGARPAQVYLLLDGLVRSFYSRADGRFFNKGFACAGEFFGSLESALTQAPCRYAIQALEPSRLAALDIADLLRMVREHPEAARLHRIEVRRAFLCSEEREAVLLTLDAAGRYRWLRQRHPALLQRVAHYHLAAYLGITPVSLSKARRAVEGSDGPG